LAHLVQKLTSYEQRHLEIYQDKFKCRITLIDTENTEDSREEQEVVVAEWTWGVQITCLASGQSSKGLQRVLTSTKARSSRFLIYY
jgi:hypothetical protein